MTRVNADNHLPKLMGCIDQHIEKEIVDLAVCEKECMITASDSQISVCIKAPTESVATFTLH